MKFIAGIDGGGTKTSLICRDLSGRDLCHKNFGPFNLNSIGEVAFSALLHEISGFLHNFGTCSVLCIGAAGCSNPRMQQMVAETMEWIPDCRLVGDHEIALWGALGDVPGCAVVAGTGSICIGRNRYGDMAQAGGWGHLIGDFGSGYALGRDALVAATRAVDYCGPKTMLTDMIAKELDLDNREKIIEYIYGGDKSRLATVSILTEKAALLGDPVAEEILDKNAGELVVLCQAVCRKLKLERAEIAMMGGLMERETGLRRCFLEKMNKALPAMNCIAPKNSAAVGAVLLAERWAAL